ncbi:MAG: 4-(cytidine 5'-diphospho)-2-C-methyl-D-erythritol kinase [Propionibacteriaceae bacterium]|jgi:4-diphosphocytidyl-2-C-methyl-D-erythritol kinase|nr:4-(cytidine 5'-diphospho)-2-C-methyl-D-erythritol kinase [Propionibacteriaceae bacterium]
MSVAVATFDDEVWVRVPGKINLALVVGPRGKDGYHDLATVFQAVGLYDEVRAISQDDEVTCQVNGLQARQVGPAHLNLAVQAAELLRRSYHLTQGVHLVIDKQIPVAGGMAGGSADAAGALLACAELWELDLTSDDLMELGAQLGADVPFLLMGGCALGLGRGEALTPALSRGVCHWVLALSSQGLSTPQVYAEFDKLAAANQTAPAHPQPPRELMMTLASGDMARLGGLLINDLDPAARSLNPGLTAIMRAGRDAGSLGAIISGSGPTIAFLTADQDAATELAVTLSSLGMVQQIRVVTGPVPGATIIR